MWLVLAAMRRPVTILVAVLAGLVGEGLLGALLTGLMVLLFLRDWRGAVIVVATIPFALLAAVVLLWAAGQTINIMTLAGLALAVGVLVDEATVTVESIHTHLGHALSRPRAVIEASRKTAAPRLMAMVSILAVFVPSFFMAGTTRQLFVPLSLAVGFAMVASYLLSSSLVPVLSTRIMRGKHETGRTWWFRTVYGAYLRFVLRFRWPLVGAYATGASLIIWLLVPRIGTEIFPVTDTGQLQVRIRAPAGTVIEQTELIVLKTMDVIRQVAGPDNVELNTDFVGVQASSYPINTIYLFTGGPQEAVLRVALKPGAAYHGEELRERLRQAFAEALPGTSFSFEAPDIISQVMSFGSPTPIEVDVQGPNMPANREHAARIYTELEKIQELRDLQYVQALDYPTLDVTVDRNRAGQFNLAMADVARSLVTATSSSRFVAPNYWRDPRSGNAFQIQVQVAPHRMTSPSDVEALPVMADGASNWAGHPLVGDLAHVQYGSAFGEVDRYNMQRLVSITANIHGAPLGGVSGRLRSAIARAGTPPQGATVFVRGQIPPLEETQSGLGNGVLFAIAVIFLLLAANFQSLRLALATVAAVPAVLCGVLLMLLLTHTTLNVQSFMGAIMAVGISVANAILLVTFAETNRRQGRSVLEAAATAGIDRLRAILMTASAMIAGMVPMAIGVGEGGQQAAPLGRAVIGGLLVATFATLTALPCIYAILQGHARQSSPSLDPDDPTSRYYEKP